MSAFKPVEVTPNFPEIEATILRFWKDQAIFQKSLKARENAKQTHRWVFYEGPPTANGRPHPGHVLTRVVKDLFPRYKTMCGYYVGRKAGWDTHGLPVEIEVEKELKLDGKAEVEKYGVEPFVRKCMDSVFRYTVDWERLTEKIGFWIDLDDAYVTYHQSYVESVWWSLKELHKKQLLYRGHKILPWCPHCQTALSSHEVGLGYREIEDPSVFVTFRDVDYESNRTSFLAWTTTPWTLPSNVALAVKADVDYSYVKVGDEILIMASALVSSAMGKIPHEVVKTEPGSVLVGRRYRPLFDWSLPLEGGTEKEAWKVLAADFVTLDTGSGIVHIAPAFGADDYGLAQREGLPIIQPVLPSGRFNDQCGDFAGRFVKEADPDLVKDLRARGLLLKRETYRHEYPFCWRCKNPLIYYARGGWFIRTTSEIAHVMENNLAVDWHPEHIKEGRFGSFLATNVDWALSRERYWGTPLNVWVCPGCGRNEMVASFSELTNRPNVQNLDVFERAKESDPTLSDHLRVHKPWIDAVTFDCPDCGQTMRRTPEVIDCWYDSGAMPFAQWGFPNTPGSKEQFSVTYPADFISEAIDQTRGWFYSLMVESTLLQPSFASELGSETRPYPVPFKTCLVLGHVGDEKGEKLSKSNPEHRLPKYDPNSILDEEGADALRWFFYSSTNPWTGARFSRPSVREAQKEFLIKLRNVYSFFVIYANIDGYGPPEFDGSSMISTSRDFSSFPLLDRWIISELQATIESVRQRLDDYDIFNAAAALNTFVDSLSNWYLRRSRQRFWSAGESPDHKSAADREKLCAYETLHHCLLETAKLIAPFVPFTAEEIYQNLWREPMLRNGWTGDLVPESVHLCDYAQSAAEWNVPWLREEVALVREIASLGRAARANAKLRTRQPLAKLIVVLSDSTRDEIVRKHEQVLLEELNVKLLEIAHQADRYVNYELKPNFRAMGAKYRDLVPFIKAALQSAQESDLRSYFSAGRLELRIDGKSVELTPEEVQVTLRAKEGFAAAGGQTVVVVLDTHLNQDLLDEGVARELVNRINGWRGELKLPYEQRIRLALKGSARLEEVARKFEAYIAGETLASEFTVGEIAEGWQTADVSADGETATLALEKTGN
ncbi:MAG: isoleucine--tRNA ligase [Acidobacteria bacterium]|nr:MAG: isoleucine--tRNA ligase [Acidobacteriota bacterium]